MLDQLTNPANNIQALLNKYKGGALDQDGDGDTDLQGLTKMVSGGGRGISQ